MTINKKFDETQFWTILIIVFPVIILGNVGNALAGDSGMGILYGGVFGGIAGIIGFTADFLTKDKTRVVKILTAVGIIVLSISILYFSTAKPTDAEILKQEWITQKIAGIEFDTPIKLELQTDEIPESAISFYSEMNVYSNENNGRISSFIQTKVLSDTVLMEDAFFSRLEGMLQKIQVNLEEVEIEILGVDSEEISAMFSFLLHKEKVNGYGFMYSKGNALESIWLMPIERGFSREYIEEFEAGIFPDY